MRILSIHARSFSYKVVEKAVEEFEPLNQANVEGTFENSLVVFLSIEADDTVDLVEEASSEILNISNQVKPSIIVLYPYAHLSSQLAPPHKAIEVLDALYKALLKRSSIPVHKAPFGWYKSFKLECYGHPLSELSRTITKKSQLAKRPIEREFYIVTPSGKVFKPEEFDYTNYRELKVLVDKEVYGIELEGGENRVNYYCKKFGLEWESMSDHGHMRYSPYAAVIMEAVSRYSWQVARDLGIPVFRVMGTNMFNLRERPVYEHAALFGDRLYEVEVDNERYVLRYAACHQQFAMLRDWIISYKDLPFGVFEIADSYRLEQRGELSLCFRLRKFYMPDLHILTKDLNEAIEVSKIVQRQIHREAYKAGRKYIALYNVTKDFFENHRDTLVEFIKNDEYPALVAVIPSGIYYWVLNVEYHIIDNLNRPREIATFQIDIGNSKRFEITYVDEAGNKKYPVIIHTAIIGSIERYIYMILDNAALMEKSGQIVSLPTWLSPIQVRVIPVSREYNEYAYNVAKRILEEKFRVDVDDRDITLGKKIREAGILWIPYIVVLGEREYKTQTLNVRIRSANKQVLMRLEEFIEILKRECEGYPQVEPFFPLSLSRQPIFLS
ncbi:MAG: threonine--tRNA ligase [Desulfurococcaceae archaeon]|nr:threonine--tRNA ligase [Desulfurococcaceae archaeon]